MAVTMAALMLANNFAAISSEPVAPAQVAAAVAAATGTSEVSAHPVETSLNSAAAVYDVSASSIDDSSRSTSPATTASESPTTVPQPSMDDGGNRKVSATTENGNRNTPWLII